ncbi:MAG: T9SS type A sorting domain-containing protein [Ginsengibacter sp.]
MIKKFLLLYTLTALVFAANAQNYTDSIPVRLKSFEASRTNNSNKLYWAVACFLNYAKFDIQRSDDGKNFTTINSFKADQLRCRQPFTYEDRTANGKVFYRLKVGDLDGRDYISKITVLISKTRGFDIASLTPTLINIGTTVTITSAGNDAAMITVVNLQGSPVVKKTISLFKGNNDISLNLSALSPGIYVLTSVNSEGELKKIRFIKQ